MQSTIKVAVLSALLAASQAQAGFTPDSSLAESIVQASEGSVSACGVQFKAYLVDSPRSVWGVAGSFMFYKEGVVVSKITEFTLDMPTKNLQNTPVKNWWFMAEGSGAVTMIKWKDGKLWREAETKGYRLGLHALDDNATSLLAATLAHQPIVISYEAPKGLVRQFDTVLPLSKQNVEQLAGCIETLYREVTAEVLCTGSRCLDTVLQLRLPLAWHKPDGLRGVT